MTVPAAFFSPDWITRRQLTRTRQQHNRRCTRGWLAKPNYGRLTCRRGDFSHSFHFMRKRIDLATLFYVTKPCPGLVRCALTAQKARLTSTKGAGEGPWRSGNSVAWRLCQLQRVIIFRMRAAETWNKCTSRTRARSPAACSKRERHRWPHTAQSREQGPRRRRDRLLPREVVWREGEGGEDPERNSVAVLLLGVCERRPPNCVARRYGTRGGFPGADQPHLRGRRMVRGETETIISPHRR